MTPKGKLEHILSIIEEDSVDSPSTSVVAGNELQYSSPATNVDFATLEDLLRYKSGMDIGNTQKKVLGVPLQNIMEQLVDVYVKNQMVRDLFKQAAENPVYRDRPEYKQVFNRIDAHLKAIVANIKSISRELDKLSLD